MRDSDRWGLIKVNVNIVAITRQIIARIVRDFHELIQVPLLLVDEDLGRFVVDRRRLIRIGFKLHLSVFELGREHDAQLLDIEWEILQF